jgi:ADP-heptose:LPS heptosyltransferase
MKIGNRPKNILVVGPAWVGDIVIQSLFQVIKQQDTSAVIDVLATLKEAV